MPFNVEPLLSSLRAHAQRCRREADARDRAYLRSLQWTDAQLSAFDRRVMGIHRRADRVLGLELCHHGTTYAACRRGCPPWPWPRTGLPNPRHYPPMPAVKPPREDSDSFEGPFGTVRSGTCEGCHRTSHVLSRRRGLCPECWRASEPRDGQSMQELQRAAERVMSDGVMEHAAAQYVDDIGLLVSYALAGRPPRDGQ